VPGPQGPQGPGGPSGVITGDTGTISGTASLYNEFSFRDSTQAGIVVTLISGTSQQQYMTTTSGQYQFHGIPTGTFDFTFAKQGYGTMKRFGISHFGGGNQPTQVSNVDLVQIPLKTAIDSISTSITYPDYVRAIITLDTSSAQYVQYYQNFAIFVGKDSTVGPTSFVKEYNQIAGPDGLGNYVFIFEKADVSSYFNTGDNMYISICAYNRYLHPTQSPLWLFDDIQNESYIDPTNGALIFPSAGFIKTTLKVAF
jgi:hypothetical protein